MSTTHGRVLSGLAAGLLVLLVAFAPPTAPRGISWRVAGSTGVRVGSSRAGAALTTLPPPGAARPAVAPPTADYRLDRPPSISAARIDTILAAYHSPAAGTGAVFYDLGVRYGIDPAYALAFYIVESQAGTRGVARFTHGIGNIRTTPGYQDYAGYRVYDTVAAGIADWYALIRHLYIEQWDLRTPTAILPRYAPAGDNNDPGAYAAAVEELVHGWSR